MPKYAMKDSNTYNATYGELRKWAADCPEVKAWMKKNLPAEIFEEVPEVTYHIGQRILIGPSSSEYILAVTEDGRTALIGLNDGCRWKASIPVKDYYKITEAEMVQITGITYSWKVKDANPL